MSHGQLTQDLHLMLIWAYPSREVAPSIGPSQDQQSSIYIIVTMRNCIELQLRM